MSYNIPSLIVSFFIAITCISASNLEECYFENDKIVINDENVNVIDPFDNQLSLQIPALTANESDSVDEENNDYAIDTTATTTIAATDIFNDISADKKTLLDLGADIFLLIATYVRSPLDSIGSVNKYLRALFTSEVTLPKVLSSRYKDLGLLEDSPNLIWFLRPPLYSSSDPKLMCRFIVSLLKDFELFSLKKYHSDDAQRQNNQIIILEWILNYITELDSSVHERDSSVLERGRSVLERSFYMEGNEKWSVVDKISGYFLFFKQFHLLKKLILAYPSADYYAFYKDMDYEDASDLFTFFEQYFNTKEFIAFLIIQIKKMKEYEDFPKYGMCRNHVLSLFAVFVFSFSRLSPSEMYEEIFYTFMNDESKFPEMFYVSFANFCKSDYLNQDDTEASQFERNVLYFNHFITIFSKPESTDYINKARLLNSIRFDRSFKSLRAVINISQLPSEDLELFAAVAIVGDKVSIFEELFEYFDSVFIAADPNHHSTLLIFILKNLKNCSWSMQVTNIKQKLLKHLLQIIQEGFYYLSTDKNAIIELILSAEGYSSVNEYLYTSSVPVDARLSVLRKTSVDITVLNSMLPTLNGCSESFLSFLYYVLCNDELIATTSDDDFEQFLLNILQRRKYFGLTTGISISASIEAILRIYENPNLHQFFTDFKVVINGGVLLKALKSTELRNRLLTHISLHGRKFGYDQCGSIKDLTLYSEFEAFFKIFSVEKKTHVLNNLRCSDQDIWNVYSIRHLLLYCLRISSSKENSSDLLSFWDKIPSHFLNLLYFEDPEELKKSFNSYLNSLPESTDDQKIQQLQNKFLEICTTTDPFK